MQLRYTPDVDAEDSDYSYIGFQVKSFVEIGGEGWLTKLMAQCWEATSRVQLVEHYVLLCTDSGDKKARAAMREAFASLGDNQRVTTIHPENIFTFLHLTEQRIAAFIKAKLSKDDPVFRDAVESLEGYTPTEAAIIIECMARFFVEEVQNLSPEMLQSRFVEGVFERCPDIDRAWYFEDWEDDDRPEFLGRNVQERFESDYSLLEFSQFDVDSHAGTVRPTPDSYMAIRALLLDAVVRYEYRGDDLRTYLLYTLVEEQLQRAEELVRPPEAESDLDRSGLVAFCIT